MDHNWRFLFIFLMFLMAACAPANQEVGILEGHVTIGPLVPAVQDGVPEPTPAPEVYAARQIVVYNKSGNREITRLEIDSSGWYQGELPVGQYLVDINRIGIDSAAGLPQVVTINAGAVTHLDVDIDTGIR